MNNTKNAYQKFLKLEPLLHLFLWSAVLFYPYIKYLGKEGGYPMSFLHELNSLFFKMTISYFLYLWFFPKKKKLKHIPIVIIIFIANALLYEFFDRKFHSGNDHFWKHFVANSLTYISFGIMFFTLYSIKNLYKKQEELDTLSQEKKEAEMKALKAQVNPHFLFNTLNTIYASSLKKEQIQQTIAAETEAKVAEFNLTKEKKQFEVEQFKAKSKKVAADAQYYENSKLVSAGLTPQERAEWEYRTSVDVARELKVRL